MQVDTLEQIAERLGLSAERLADISGEHVDTLTVAANGLDDECRAHGSSVNTSTDHPSPPKRCTAMPATPTSSPSR
jgi:hypothetical protein